MSRDTNPELYERPDIECCSGHSCIFKRPKGMGHNGPCHGEQQLKRSREGWQAVLLIDYLRQQIEKLENENQRLSREVSELLEYGELRND